MLRGAYAAHSLGETRPYFADCADDPHPGRRHDLDDRRLYHPGWCHTPPALGQLRHSFLVHSGRMQFLMTAFCPWRAKVNPTFPKFWILIL